MDDEVFLSGNFQQYPECKKLYTVRLGRTKLIYEEKLEPTAYTKLSKGITSVELKDVVSARLFDSKVQGDLAAYFQLISYPMLNNAKKKKGKRRKCLLTFRVNESVDYEENMMAAETWARTLEWLVSNPNMKQEELEGII